MEAKDVASSFTAKVITDKVTRTIRGSVFGRDLLRIIEISGMEFVNELYICKVS